MKRTTSSIRNFDFAECGRILYFRKQSQLNEPKPNVLFDGSVSCRIFKYTMALADNVNMWLDDRSALGAIKCAFLACRIDNNNLKTEFVVKRIGSNSQRINWRVRPCY